MRRATRARPISAGSVRAEPNSSVEHHRPLQEQVERVLGREPDAGEHLLSVWRPSPVPPCRRATSPRAAVRSSGRLDRRSGDGGSSLDGDQRVGELVAHRLERGDRPAELRAVDGMAAGQVEHPARRRRSVDGRARGGRHERQPANPTTVMQPRHRARRARSRRYGLAGSRASTPPHAGHRGSMSTSTTPPSARRGTITRSAAVDPRRHEPVDDVARPSVALPGGSAPWGRGSTTHVPSATGRPSAATTHVVQQRRRRPARPRAARTRRRPPRAAPHPAARATRGRAARHRLQHGPSTAPSPPRSSWRAARGRRRRSCLRPQIEESPGDDVALDLGVPP